MVTLPEVLADTEYPGRFIAVGRSHVGTRVFVYGLTGRSPPSQARELLEGSKAGVIRTSPINDADDLKRMFGIEDESQLAELQEKIKSGSDALLRYPALATYRGGVVMSNGIQTELLYSALKHYIDGGRKPVEGAPNEIIREALDDPVWRYDEAEDRWIDITSHEPDEPNYTPRINLVNTGNFACFRLITKGDERGDAYQKRRSTHFSFALNPGRMMLLATYAGKNVNPLPSWWGEPLELELPRSWGNAQDIAGGVYESLNPEVRVGVAVLQVSDALGPTNWGLVNRVDHSAEI